MSILMDIFVNLSASSTPGIYETVVKKALPRLSVAISSSTKDESWIGGSAIDLVASLVKGAAESRLGEGFFQLLGPYLFSCLSTAEDRDVLQASPVLLSANSF
jgi:importin-9